MMITDIIKKSIQSALVELDISYDGDITIEHPRELSHGDFATNIAMVLAKKEGKNPRELAEALSEKITAPEISSVEVAGPGFINIKLIDEFFSYELKVIQEKGDFYGWNDSWEGKRILVEHSSPNLFKPFHIGHMMNNTVGEAMTRLCRTTSAEVTMISYPSDVSLGIGKAVWQFLQYGIEKINEFKTVSEKMAFLGKCYAEGTQAFKDNENIEPRVREITQDIYEHRDTEAHQAYKIGRDLNLEYFIQMTARLGSAFDGFIFESEAGKIGKEIITKHTPSVYTESNGAIIFEPNEKDLEKNKSLHTRVFINKDGNPTYEAKDTGLLKLKFDRYNPELSIFITDSEQGPYFEVVETAAGKVHKEWQEKTIHKTHGRMQFKGQKMSSRLGNTPIVSDILDAVNEEVYVRAGDRELSQDQADMISIAAVKYAVLRTQAGKNINFDPDTSLSFEGDSGPYLQYTYARSQSMLRKAQEQGIEVSANRPEDWETTDIERYLYRYPIVVEQAFKDLAPHHVVTYITELAQLFNSWYGNTKIVDADNQASGYKLALTDATAQVIKNGLWILGISAPEEM
ncbi:MAG: arginine--tRNA ligase [Candidatus Pacebacteria bacterium]|nr:arginine--tRNA ligase [Candidatus Paceibacterota bacterium]